MLRKILMTTVAATTLAGSALAADLPSRRPPPAAYVPPVPIFTWTGFYLGVNAGGAFRANNNGNNGVFIPGFGFVANNSSNNARFIGGGQAGVNYQINQFVVGIEGDGQALVGSNNNNGNNFFGFGNNGNNTRFLGTVRGRGGIAFDRLLVYGTGGVAFGTGPTINNFNPFLVGAGPFVNNVNNGNNWRVGYTVGAGVEYAFLPNWSVKAEYLFTDLGRTNNNNGFFFNNNNFRERNHIVRAGINYHFNWFAPAPVVARY